jgi:hypothetical protein
MFKHLHLLAALVALLLLQSVAVAQSKNVVGLVVDTGANTLPATTVVLLQATDSVLYQFTITDDNGTFLFKNVAPGDYVMQLSFLGHAEQNVNITVGGEKPVINAGTIILFPKMMELGMFTVTGRRIPILFKQDTIEYNADAFKVQPGSVVEDLLKKMPGIEVQKDGTIKAQGQEVGKVLVDGKEFFGDDPTLATKNLPAEAIDKVQVFDKKSETAEFTGVNDGNEQKTINLTLKEDHKRGYFGDATVGYGTEQRYIGKGNLHRFSPKTQMSAIGMMNNVNEQGFSFEDYINFMGGMQAIMGGGGGGFMDTEQLGVPMNFGLSNGFVNTGALGTNLNVDFSEKTKLNSSYFFSQISNDIYSETDRTYYAGFNNVLSNEVSDNFSTVQSHRFNYKLEHTINGKQDLKLIGSVRYNDGSSRSTTDLWNYSSENILQSSASTLNTGSATDGRVSNELIYRKKFSKKGRYFVGSGSFGISRDQRLGNLDATNSILLDSLGLTTSTLLQDQIQDNDWQEYGGRISFTEPLGKKKYLEFSYERKESVNKIGKFFYDIGTDGQEVENEDLTEKYTNTFLFDRGGIAFKRNKKKNHFTASARMQFSQLNGTLTSADTSLSRSYTHVLPSVRWNKQFTNSKRLTAYYQTGIQAPSIQQLQPIISNSDPLNIYVGNPTLNPEYQHRGAVQFMSFSRFSSTEFFASLDGAYIQDKITNSVDIDAQLRQTTQPINVKDDARISAEIGFGTPIKKLKTKLGVENSTSLNRGILFVNGTENVSERLQSELTANLSNRNQDVFSVELGSRYGWNQATYSENADLNQTWVNWLHYVEAGVTIKEHWRLSSVFDWNIYTGSAFEEDQDMPIWQASLTRYLAQNKIRIKVSVKDILNRNNGYSRSNRLNYVQEQQIRTLGRFALFSVSYRINGFKSQNGTSIEVNGR